VEQAVDNTWKKCSSCKKPIALGARYYTCSVSTCNGQRTGYVFCSVACFEVHLPSARHKDAAAIENKAPMKADPSPAAAGMGREPTRKIISTPTPPGSAGKQSAPREVLIIASRLKEFVQARADMNTSAQVVDVLSDYVRIITDRAIDNARAAGRKTLMDRDFDFLKE
jgi:hypothetical protein